MLYYSKYSILCRYVHMWHMYIILYICRYTQIYLVCLLHLRLLHLYCIELYAFTILQLLYLYYRYICTMTDLFSKFVFARPIETKGAASVCAVLLEFIYLYGPPKKFLSDQGREFVNEVSPHVMFIVLICIDRK
jgi:hypothetical protein